MMQDETMLLVIASCFAPVDEGEWKHISTGGAWSDFLDATRRALQDGRALGCHAHPSAQRSCPLQDFLSVGEVNSLFCPPTFQDKQAFAAQHFVGGLPSSAVPVESLYRPWTEQGQPSPFARTAGGLYGSDAALYMRDLIERLGFQVPPAFSACPDHLALQLEVASMLLQAGLNQEAQLFLTERLAWLTAYRLRLLQLDADARFYIGLIDVLMGIWIQVAPMELSV